MLGVPIVVAAIVALMVANHRHLRRCQAVGVCPQCEGAGTYLDPGGIDSGCSSCGGDGNWHRRPVWHPAH